VAYGLSDDQYILKFPVMSFPDFRLTPSEVIALYMLKGNTQHLKGTGIESHIRSAFNKLDNFLADPQKIRKQLSKIRSLLVSHGKHPKVYNEENIETIKDAMLDNRICEIKFDFPPNRPDISKSVSGHQIRTLKRKKMYP